MNRRLPKDNATSKIIIESAVTKTYDSLDKPVTYLPSTYGLSSTLTGEDVRICLIDSGTPEHKDITIDGDSVSFCENTKNAADKTGHATMVAGLISAVNKEQITGLAPRSKIDYLKVIDDLGQCSFNSVVAAILWAIVKETDIILLPLGTQYDYTILHDAVRKAAELNICIIASAGNNISKQSDIDFPSRYPEVFSVASLSKSENINKIIREKSDFAVNASGLLTTHMNNKYVKVGGSSLATAIVGGLAAVLIEQYRKDNKEVSNKAIYSDLAKFLSN